MDITVRIEAEKIGQPTKRDRSEFSVSGAEATITADMQQVPESEFGGFAMTMHRGAEGQLYLTVPHPGDGFPHMRLTEVRPGFYEVTSL